MPHRLIARFGACLLALSAVLMMGLVAFDVSTAPVSLECVTIGGIMPIAGHCR